jgi:RNA polymerase sigma-70 factor (ECF subfamily)
MEKWILESADLKPIHRACVILRYVQGMTRAEVAATTGLSEMQVKGHLQYALVLLRRTYGVSTA